MESNSSIYDSWMASLTQWTRVWLNSWRWWLTGRPGMLWFMGSQGVGHDWVTELNWTDTPKRSFPCSSAGNKSTCNAEGPSFITGFQSSPGEEIGYPCQYSWCSLVAQLVNNMPAMQETWFQSLDLEIPWRKAWRLTPVFLPRESPWREEPGGYSPWGLKELDTTERLSTYS